jgi:UDP-glucose 4-epimerase
LQFLDAEYNIIIGQRTKMNILLTGGTGYIGSHTAVVLSASGHQVLLYDNLSNSSDSVVDAIIRITQKEIRFVKGDIRDTKLVRDTLISHDIDAVIHFAALKAVGESVRNPLEYYDNNVEGAICLLKAMRSARVNRLVFSSSATVYGNPRYLPVDENHPTSPINPYGRSKLYVEEMLADVAAADFNWHIACLRYFNPIGAHESGLIGENLSATTNNLIPHIANVAAGERAALSVFGGDYLTPDGTGIRDYVHVMDIAAGHSAALAFLSRAPGWHAVNLGTGKGYSVLEIIQAFEKASGCRVPYKVMDRRPGDVAASYANVNKASELLKWRVTHDLHDMCSSAWRFQQSRGSLRGL